MSIDRDNPEHAPHATASAPETASASDYPDANIATAQPDGETLLREWHGLPSDAQILFPIFHPAPMRAPEDAWAMLVTAIDIIGDEDPERRGAVDLFAGRWTDQTPADGVYDGDLVVRLTTPPTTGAANTADVEMLLAHHGQWQRVGFWPALDDTWPQQIAPTAAAVMNLHTEIVEAGVQCNDAMASMLSPMIGRSFGGTVFRLLEAGLVKPGDEFVWDRRNHGSRHMITIRPDGTLALADGRVCHSPNAATTALGGVNHDGWTAFTRESDGRTLASLRAEAHQRRAN